MPRDSLGVAISQDVSWVIALRGQIYAASDADQNDRVTGQTSFANTTPTFILHNPSNSAKLCFPFFFQIVQTGSVAGGDIFVEVEARATSAYSSGGTSEGVSNLFFGAPSAYSNPTNSCLLYSGATAGAGAGRKMGHFTLAPDVSPAEGVINVPEWSAPTGLIIGPGASLDVYTYAASTGPTWDWHFVWAEIPVQAFS